MTFQHPAFLWALGLLVVPILIHLFNFRRYKKVQFSNVEMLKELHTESKKTRQIKKWLILASRLLALACLILAFALPYIPTESQKTGKALVSIYLDNSQSMLGEGEDGQLFENGKNVARQIIDLLPSDADIQILDNQISPYSNRVFAKEQATNLIDDMEMTHFPNRLSPILQQAQKKKTAESYGSQVVFAISDFQGLVSENEPILDSSIQVNFIRMNPETEQNLSIDTVWVDAPIVRPGSPVVLSVRVTNNGNTDVESSTLTMKINGVQQGVESFGLRANTSETFQMEFSTTQAGWIAGEFEISDVPIVFDNRYYFTLEVKSHINVLSIGQRSKSIAKLFENDKIFKIKYNAQGSIDYAAFPTYDFIVLNELSEIGSGLTEQLDQFAKAGGVVLVIPGIDSDNYTSFSRVLGLPYYLPVKSRDAGVSSENLNNSFLRDVYKRIPKNSLLPKVNKSFQLQTTGRSSKILTLKDGSALLTKTSVGYGSVFQWALPLGKAYSNLADHELYVLAMLKMAFSKNEQKQLATELHNREPITLPISNPSNEIYLIDGDRQIVVESARGRNGTRLWLNDEMDQAGVFDIQAKSGEMLAKLALNFSRTESSQRYASDDMLMSIVGDAEAEIVSNTLSNIKTVVEQFAGGKSLWKMFIFLSLLFLLIEVLLLRFLKT